MIIYRCLCFRRLHRLRLLRLLAVTIAAFLVLYLIEPWWRSPYLVVRTNYDVPLTTNDDQQTCVFPRMEVNNEEMLSVLPSDPDVTCPPEKNWVTVDNGTFVISAEARRAHGHIECGYVPIIRGKDDFSITQGPVIKPMISGAKIPSDFFKVECTASDGSYHTNFHEAIRYHPNLHKPHRGQHLLPDSMGVNVLIFGLDSISRMLWQRKLPLVHDFLMNELNAFVFEGYNIVGDGTPQAILPLLTGHTEIDLPEARREVVGSVSMDGFPFIWKDFKRLGYITQMSEDDSKISMFTYRMTGFDKQPTDHYGRPYFIAAEKDWRSFFATNTHCTGSETNIQLNLNWINDTYRMYPNRHKFMFHFFSEYSHNPFRIHLRHVDVRLRDFLRKFAADGNLDNTILVVMSDHGHRFSKARNTAQGKLEERLPYVSISVPPWFRTRYPSAYHNLGINTRRLTTAFDMHETLRDIVSSNRDIPNGLNRGMSLFREIPADRRCRDADIADHWCACLDWQEVSTDDDIVTSLAIEVVKYFNQILEEAATFCAPLSLTRVISVHTRTPNTKLTRFAGTKDSDGRVQDFSLSSRTRFAIYQLVIMTAPNNGRYELTLNYDSYSKKITLDPRQVSRTNAYGKDYKCISDTFPHLRQFCLCQQK